MDLVVIAKFIRLKRVLKSMGKLFGVGPLKKVFAALNAKIIQSFDMKTIILFLFFCLISNAAVIIQENNDQYGVRTTIEQNGAIYSYKYEVKLSSFSQGELYLFTANNQLVYYQKPENLGSFVTIFESYQSPEKGYIKLSENPKFNAWVPSVPETQWMYFPIVLCFLLTRRRNLIRC